jgi:two-component system response regulator ResD
MVHSPNPLCDPGKSGSLLILVVDDDEDLRTLARIGLSRAGYRVLEAATGIEGLEFVASHSPDLILLDMNMPGMDGAEVVRRLRSGEPKPSTPVILLSAMGDEASLRRMFELDINDYLMKPFTHDQLAARVSSCLTRAHPGGGTRGDSTVESI